MPCFFSEKNENRANFVSLDTIFVILQVNCCFMWGSKLPEICTGSNFLIQFSTKETSKSSFFGYFEDFLVFNFDTQTFNLLWKRTSQEKSNPSDNWLYLQWISFSRGFSANRFWKPNLYQRFPSNSSPLYWNQVQENPLVRHDVGKKTNH